MHELPEELSIYGASGHDNRSSDVEKGHDDYGDKDFERALNPTQSSVVLHPTKSRRALNQPQPDVQPHTETVVVGICFLSRRPGLGPTLA
ncbi:hypothetical protein LTR02_008179 [Friedmanniomyces endolithicus]|nr:hypothetical protein LTR02_008179 [Friedmanniomyces endolithicus]